MKAKSFCVGLLIGAAFVLCIGFNSIGYQAKKMHRQFFDAQKDDARENKEKMREEQAKYTAYRSTFEGHGDRLNALEEQIQILSNLPQIKKS